MPEKTQKEMVARLYQAVIGLEENPEDNGLIGDVLEIKRDVKRQNSRIGKLEGKQKLLYGLIAGAGAVGGGMGTAIAKVFGG